MDHSYNQRNLASRLQYFCSKSLYWIAVLVSELELELVSELELELELVWWLEWLHGGSVEPSVQCRGLGVVWGRAPTRSTWMLGELLLALLLELSCCCWGSTRPELLTMAHIWAWGDASRSQMSQITDVTEVTGCVVT